MRRSGVGEICGVSRSCRQRPGCPRRAPSAGTRRPERQEEAASTLNAEVKMASEAELQSSRLPISAPHVWDQSAALRETVRIYLPEQVVEVADKS